MRTDAFDATVAACVALLRELPRGRDAVVSARERFSAFARAHGETPAHLMVELAPGRDQASYDALLSHPEGGTLALSWCADPGSPWLADFAEHWAANYVLSIGDIHVTVQDALSTLHLATRDDARLVDRLIDEAIARKAIIDRDIDCSPDETQAAMDATRESLGLFTAASTHDWLRNVGWTEHQFMSLVSGAWRVRKLRAEIVGDRVEPWFAEHRAQFDRVRVRRESPNGDVWITTCFALDAPSGASVLERREAQFNAATRERVEEALFRQWLDSQRALQPVRWHWL